MSGAVGAAGVIVSAISALFGVFGGTLEDWSGTKPFHDIKSLKKRVTSLLTR